MNTVKAGRAGSRINQEKNPSIFMF